jgi:adenine-specific DNA-methyltransferase
MKRKLELTWVGKEERPRLEPRLLVEEDRWGDPAVEPNLLIQGDNLLALKALEADYAGKVKCVFIDPPYNTGSAFEHYDDGLEHSIWLSMMRDRLEVIRNLLSENGSLWVTLDDNEAHYFKVMADEVLGRANFIATVIWRKNYAPKSSARHLSVDQDYVFVYAKSASSFQINSMPRTAKQNLIYSNPDNDPRGPWTSDNLSARNPYSLGVYPITTPTGRVIPGPPSGRYWSISREKLAELDRDGRIYWTSNGTGTPRLKRFLSEVKSGRVPQTYWHYDEVGHTQDAKKESVALFRDDVFGTPKPEALMQRIIHLATEPGDLVLDSFAGSGTTGAVAQKMGRRWIMVELGDHARTHIIPRLRKVIAGEDFGGVTETTGWEGGGAFRLCRLAPSLIALDRWGREVISPEYDGPLLAQALCKLEGYRFEPSETEWWIHGRSSETDFLHVTTQTLTHAQLAELSELVGEGRTLLVLCGAWRGDAAPFANLTVRKIPDHVLKRCDWGRDSYSLPEPVEAAG